MSFRPSESPEYWTTEFQLTSEDVQVLYDHVVGRERPLPVTDLAMELIETRLRRENQRIRRELARGRLYQPRDEYEVGETIVFSAYDFAAGEVVGKRPGRNPEHGEFDVIQVVVEGQNKKRSFAAGLKTPHTLNRKDGQENLAEAGAATPDKVAERYGASIRDQLEQELAAWEDPEFVSLGRYWLPSALLADIHVGHRNITEALVEVRNSPIPTAEILPDLDVPQEVPPALVAFSLDLSLSEDDRFVDVGVESREWYLKRLLPEEAVKTPRRLQHTPTVYDRSALTVPLLQMEWELDDEWTEEGATSVSVAQLPSMTLTLTYPHRRSGTLPLTNRTRSFFPLREGKRSQITFIDGRWGTRFPGWVVPEGRYVAGLMNWFEEHKLPVGAFVVLERTEDPNEVVVDFRARRMKREWARVAQVEGDTLSFQLQKQEIRCEYDPEMIVAAVKPEEVDQLRRTLYRRNPTIHELLEQIAPRLMGLSTQGTVHSKTLYSAINMVRRTEPGAIFAALTSNPRFREVGDGKIALSRN